MRGSPTVAMNRPDARGDLKGGLQPWGSAKVTAAACRCSQAFLLLIAKNESRANAVFGWVAHAPGPVQTMTSAAYLSAGQQQVPIAGREGSVRPRAGRRCPTQPENGDVCRSVASAKCLGQSSNASAGTGPSRSLCHSRRGDGTSDRTRTLKRQRSRQQRGNRLRQGEVDRDCGTGDD
jgi:hypothetical protein